MKKIFKKMSPMMQRFIFCLMFLHCAMAAKTVLGSVLLKPVHPVAQNILSHTRLTVSDPYNYSTLSFPEIFPYKNRLGQEAIFFLESYIQSIGISKPRLGTATGVRWLTNASTIQTFYLSYSSSMRSIFHSLLLKETSLDCQVVAGYEVRRPWWSVRGGFHSGFDSDDIQRTKTGVGITVSIMRWEFIVPTATGYARVVQRRYFRVTPKPSRDVIVDRYDLYHKYGIRVGFEVPYNPIYSVSLHYTYDNLTASSIGISFHVNQDGYHYAKGKPFKNHLWKPVQYHAGPPLERYIQTDRSAFRQEVQATLEDEYSPRALQLADCFHHSHPLYIRQETAKRYLWMTSEQKINLYTFSQLSVPSEIASMINEYALTDLTNHNSYSRFQLKSVHIRLLTDHMRFISSNKKEAKKFLKERQLWKMHTRYYY